MTLPSQNFSVVPLVPPGRPPSEFAVQRAARGVLGTRDLVKGSFVPAVRSAPTGSLARALPAASGGLAIGGVVLGIANVGLGIFNGVMSWKINKKLNRVLAAQDLQGRDISEILHLVQQMDVDAERRHAEVMAGFDRLIEHDLRSTMFELTDRLEELAERPIPADAERIRGLAGAASGQIQSLLARMPAGAPERVGLVQALTFTRVAEADARFVLASEDPNHLHLAARLREKAAEQVSREIQEALRHNTFVDIIGDGVPVPVQYWGLRAGLRALPVTQEADEPLVLDLRWGQEGVEGIRAALSAPHAEAPTEYLIPNRLEEAEALRQLEGAATIGNAHCWDASEFMAFLGSPERPASTAQPVLEAIADSGWMDAFAEDTPLAEEPPAQAHAYTFDTLTVEPDEEDAQGEDPPGQGTDECQVSWAADMVTTALDMFDNDIYDEGRPMRAELVLRAAGELVPPRPDLVDRAVRAMVWQRLNMREVVGNVLTVDLEQALALAATRGEARVRSWAGILMAQAHSVDGHPGEAAAALDLVLVPDFFVEDFEWLQPLLRLREVDAEGARSLYKRWLEAPHSGEVAALCKARRSVLILRSQRSGPARKPVDDFERAMRVLQSEPSIPNLVLESLTTDFEAARSTHEPGTRDSGPESTGLDR